MVGAGRLRFGFCFLGGVGFDLGLIHLPPKITTLIIWLKWIVGHVPPLCRRLWQQDLYAQR